MLKASIHGYTKGYIASKPFLFILFTTLVVWHDHYLIRICPVLCACKAFYMHSLIGSCSGNVPQIYCLYGSLDDSTRVTKDRLMTSIFLCRVLLYQECIRTGKSV